MDRQTFIVLNKQIVKKSFDYLKFSSGVILRNLGAFRVGTSIFETQI